MVTRVLAWENIALGCVGFKVRELPNGRWASVSVPAHLGNNGRYRPVVGGEFKSAAIGGKCYLVGGSQFRCSDGPAPVLCIEYGTSVNVYDVPQQQWYQTTPLHTGRTGHTCTTLNNKLYVIGGSNHGNQAVLYDIFRKLGNAHPHPPVQ